MKLLAFVPIKLTLLLILGILIGYFAPFDLKLSLIFLLSCTIILGYHFLNTRQGNLSFGIAAAFTVIAIGIFVSIYAQPKNHETHFSKLIKDQNPILKIKIREVLKPNTFSQNYIASVLSVDNTKSTGKLLINHQLDSTFKLLSVDDELFLNSRISSIKPPLNPNQFDYQKYMGYLGVYDQIRLTNTNYFKLVIAPRTIMGYAQEIRSNIIKKLQKEEFGEEQLGIIQALLLGERSNISENTYTNYINAGAVHILAVSGLHIGILLLLIQFLLRPLKSLPNGKTIILITTVLLLWGFAFIAGLSPSIIRACSMFTFVAYAMYLNRPTNNFNILALSMFFVLLIINPNLLFQVGFQMSYAAVFAIVWIYPLLQKFWFPKNKVVRYIWQLISVSIAAQLGVLPIGLFYFHQFPGLFFISNLLIVPALAIILGTGLFIIFLSLFDMVPNKLVWFYNELIGLMNTIVYWVAEQEDFILKSISFDVLQLILGYLVIVTLVYGMTRLNFKSVITFLICLFTFQTYTIFEEYAALKKIQVIIMHQTRNSVILSKNGNELNVLSTDSSNAKRLVDNYAIAERINKIHYIPIKNGYKAENFNLQIIDSSGIFIETESNTTYLLTQSPKINLERLINKNKPKKIIADGSNYSSYVERWKITCSKYKIPFHYTGEMGFYQLK
ncbi:ComEC/Rec2 family competence protein [Maribacter sp. PR1]|uniref:ComEC/Rec2 family competence protein n=1 Tax=Maribacter cobaltidurans TaxID=1178778 RepID=A0ABU7IUA1_9FLAO|nr:MULTISPECIES: ComEC/Rec2 family competence protein [Maribacter]MDC6389169.1 ComEC/Rec2 family competence protein [Maribacter sp. PR1]MEE1976557.1 ComEC/Rec2 family competence protein [Maribacter cobaltidurans]